MILAIRTDKPEAEVGLYSLNGKQIACEVWQAHRRLSMTIFDKIESLLNQRDLKYIDLTGVIFYEGPGSFTGLRIGVSIANALAFSLNIPIQSATGENWQKDAINLLKNSPKTQVLPSYGAEPHITQPKK